MFSPDRFEGKDCGIFPVLQKSLHAVVLRESNRKRVGEGSAFGGLLGYWFSSNSRRRMAKARRRCTGRGSMGRPLLGTQPQEP